MDKGDTTGALPWFAEALGFDRDEPGRRRDASTSNRHDPEPMSGARRIFSHRRPILWATLDPRAGGSPPPRPTARPGSGTSRPARRSRRRWPTTARSIGSSFAAMVAAWSPLRPTARSGSGTSTAYRAGRSVGWLMARPFGSHCSAPTVNRIVSGGFDGTIRVWDADDGSRPARLTGSGSPCWIWRSVPMGRGSRPGPRRTAARIWRLEDGRLHLLAQLRHGGPVRRVCFSPDGIRLATASQDGTARVWDGRNGDPITAPMAHTPDRWVSDVEFSPDGTRLATAGHDGTARVWDAHTGRLIESKEPGIGHPIGWARPRSARTGRDSSRPVSTGRPGSGITTTGAPISPPFYHGGSAAPARFTPDGYRS